MRGNTAPYQAVGGYPLPLGFNGRLSSIYRWFSGRPMNGHRYTDATGFRHGTMALDVSGHATSYQLLPGYLRFAYVRAPIMLAAPYALTALIWPLPMYLVTLGLVLVATWRVQAWRAVRTFRREVTEPLAAGVSAVTRVKNVAGLGHAMVDVPADFRSAEDVKITIKLPPGWVGDEGDQKRLVQVVSSRLALDDLSPSWTLSGSAPFVSLAVPPRPPAKIDLAQALLDANTCPEDEPMVGYGARGRIERMSLKLESPHMLMNAGSGAGKSVFLAWLTRHFLRHGYGIAVLDAKFVSHMWLRSVPGVLYASEGKELHEALVWLDDELLRRSRFVALGGDSTTLVPLLIILEEINSAANRLRAYWRSIKIAGDPAMSPAFTALANLASMGREMRVHVFMAGQSVTAKSTGGPESRESFQIRAFARATAKAWGMLAPQIKPAPLKRTVPGRWHLVVGDSLREIQVPFIDLKNEVAPDSVARLIENATGGKPVPDVVAMLAQWQADHEGEGGSENEDSPSVEPLTPAGISLRQYADEAGLDLRTLTRWRERRNDFPSWVGIGARGVQLFDRDHLRDYVRTRLREPVSVEED